MALLHLIRSVSRGPLSAILALAAAMLALAGCGQEMGREMSANKRAAEPATAPMAQMMSNVGGSAASGARDTSAAFETRPAAPISRKIIYNTEIDLVPENLSAAERELRRLVKSYGGYVADTEVSGQPGASRQGEWTLRVPVDRFETFVSEVARLGELQRIHTDSQDVTEDYYDSGARLANKRVEEQRLLFHLRASTGKLQEILQVEHELTRVREEIEQLQGHIQKLGRLSELATVKVQMHEVKEYVPPKAAGFGDQVGRTFHDSLAALRAAAQGAVLFIVALLPWLIAMAVIAAPIVMIVRKSRAPKDGSTLL
jgi:hypothetical protein